MFFKIYSENFNKYNAESINWNKFLLQNFLSRLKPMTQSKAGQPPLIAIIGSIEDSRSDLEFGLRNSERAKEFGIILGKQLADAGCHILVYTCDPQFLEWYIVKGFATSDNAKPGSIHVRYPSTNESAVNFSERESHPELFQLIPDTNINWESSFYKSLRDVSGIILIGGGQSTFITGHIALAYDIPLAPFASFGGSAEKIWEVFSNQSELVKEEETRFLAIPCDETTAEKTIELVDLQKKRLKEKNERNNQKLSKFGKESIIAMVFFAISLATLPLGFGLTSIDKTLFLILVFFSPVLSGASGSTIRLIQGDLTTNESSLKTFALGAVAGGISSLLYVMAQITTNPKMFLLTESAAGMAASPPYNLLFFTVTIGFIAGFTWDRVYKKLQELDALKADTLLMKGEPEQGEDSE